MVILNFELGLFTSDLEILYNITIVLWSMLDIKVMQEIAIT